MCQCMPPQVRTNVDKMLQLSNYTHLRTLVSQKQSKGDVQIDLVRSILGPTSRGYGGMQVVLKSIAVTPRTSAKALREAAIHRAVSLSWTSEARVLPLLSHFITHVLPGEGVDKDEASSSSSSSNGKRTSTPRATSTYLVLVFPFLEQGTLFDWVAKKMTSKLWRQKIGEDELRWVIVEAALALQRCHERGVVHRDVKAENILVDTLHGTPKLVSSVTKSILTAMLIPQPVSETGGLRHVYLDRRDERKRGQSCRGPR